MTKRKQLETFLGLAEVVNAFTRADELTWKEKYNLIFSPEVSKRIFKLVDLDYQPDTSYEEDVRAFARAVEEKAERVKKTLDVLASVLEIIEDENC